MTFAHSLVTNSTINHSSTSASAHVANDVPLGDFIAFGLGIAKETKTDCATCDPSGGQYTTSLHTTSFEPGPSTAVLTVNTTGATEPLITKASNSSVGLDQCWNSWSSYWDKLPNYGTHTWTAPWICQYTYAPTTMSHTSTVTESWPDQLPTTVVYTITRTFEINGFAPSTQYAYNTYTVSGSSKGTTYTSTTTWAYTQDSSCYSMSPPKETLAPPPNCTLPTTQLSQCQASWETWIDHQLTRSVVRGTETSYFQDSTDSTAPSCMQATAGSALCTELKDAYVSSRLNLQGFSRVLPSIYSEAFIDRSGGYYRTDDGPWQWPSTAYFAPNCTL